VSWPGIRILHHQHEDGRKRSTIARCHAAPRPQPKGTWTRNVTLREGATNITDRSIHAYSLGLVHAHPNVAILEATDIIIVPSDIRVWPGALNIASTGIPLGTRPLPSGDTIPNAPTVVEKATSRARSGHACPGGLAGVPGSVAPHARGHDPFAPRAFPLALGLLTRRLAARADAIGIVSPEFGLCPRSP
jgi:hypothetical protein